MASSRFAVDKSEALASKISFWSWRSSIIFSFIIGVIVVLLRINAQIYDGIVEEELLQDIGYRYSVLLLSEMHPDEIQADWAFHEPARLLDVISKPKIGSISDSEYWLRYLIVKTIATDSNATPALKKKATTVMESMLTNFQSHLPQQATQRLVLGRDAMSIHALDKAAFFYIKLLDTYPNEPLPIYQEATRAARWAKECRKSAELAIKAKTYSITLNDQRYFFFSAIQGLFQCEEYRYAMTVAKENIGSLAEDKVTLSLLADYALKAGDPSYASKIMVHLLSMQDNGEPETQDKVFW